MEFLNRLRETEGKVACYYRPLGEAPVMLNGDMPMCAASVIKLAVMTEAFRRFETGALDPNAEYVVRAEDKLPSCGALAYMHDGLTVTYMDLVTLMIILSDNTATNILIKKLGMDEINASMRALGFPGIVLRRLLFDSAAAAQGLENTITARDIGEMLSRMLEGRLVSEAADAQMLKILANQRLNGKLPFYLHDKHVKIAHKTGEDSGITHDVGILYLDKPVVLCLLSNEVDVPAFERLIQDAALESYNKGRG